MFHALREHCFRANPLRRSAHAILDDRRRRSWRAGVFRMNKKGKARELLERLLDQNEQALGLFYLHSDSDLGIGDPSVAYLRITVALKTDHYPILQGARKGRL